MGSITQLTESILRDPKAKPTKPDALLGRQLPSASKRSTQTTGAVITRAKRPRSMFNSALFSFHLGEHVELIHGTVTRPAPKGSLLVRTRRFSVRIPPEQSRERDCGLRMPAISSSSASTCCCLFISGQFFNTHDRNVAITDINPKYVWGGDAITLDGCDMIWIDHVTVCAKRGRGWKETNLN